MNGRIAISGHLGYCYISFGPFCSFAVLPELSPKQQPQSNTMPEDESGAKGWVEL